MTGTVTTAVETPTTAMVATPTGAATTVIETPTVGGTATTNPTPTILTTPVAQSTEPISKAQQALLEVDSFRISTTITETGGTIMTATLEFVLPDRAHILTDASEIIVIGTTGVWMREPGSQWQNLPGGSVVGEAFMGMIDPAEVNTALQSIDPGSVQSLGTETLNGKTMNVYQYSTTDVSGSEGLAGSTKIWVGADDGLPYRTETMTSGSGTFAGEQLSGAATIVQEYEYPTDLKIEAPM
jgi:outer membrane lipoprotein-sorting protein